jgi:dTDP-4-amino-4,6-dideoxygalactose transaminase
MMISHSRPWIGEDDMATVAAALHAGHLATGEYVHRFQADWLAGQSDCFDPP